jgi:hypothetical protein
VSLNKPLVGITVLDPTVALAGPFAALILTGLGAKLIKQLHNPSRANEWIVDQAKRHRIDAVLTPFGTRPSATGNRFIELALERAGLPELPIFASMADARSWDAVGMRRRVAQFLEQLVANAVAGRRPE